MNGTDAKHENALKKRMMNAGSTACRRSDLTHAYAPPAHAPPKSPIASGKASAPANPGLAISTTPTKASTNGNSCRRVAFSPKNSHAKSTVKNGAVLLRVCPSAMVMWLSA